MDELSLSMVGWIVLAVVVLALLLLAVRYLRALLRQRGDGVDAGAAGGGDCGGGRVGVVAAVALLSASHFLECVALSLLIY